MKTTQASLETQREQYRCPVDAAIQVLRGKWKILILWKLQGKSMRFGELKRSLPDITEKMLIQQLRELEQHEIIYRHDFQEMPLRVEYSLTQRGQKLKPIFDALWQWGEEHIYQ